MSAITIKGNVSHDVANFHLWNKTPLNNIKERLLGPAQIGYYVEVHVVKSVIRTLIVSCPVRCLKAGSSEKPSPLTTPVSLNVATCKKYLKKRIFQIEVTVTPPVTMLYFATFCNDHSRTVS